MTTDQENKAQGDARSDGGNVITRAVDQQAARLTAELTDIERDLHEAATRGDELDEEARARVVRLVEYSFALTPGGRASVAATANDGHPELMSHQEAGLNVVRALAIHDGIERRNPFPQGNLSQAYDSAFEINQAVIEADIAAWERDQGELVQDAIDNPSLAAIADIRAERQADATMQELPETYSEQSVSAHNQPSAAAGPHPDQLAKTFIESRDVQAKVDAARQFPELTDAFAYEAALSRFADERLAVHERGPFMTRQRVNIASDIKSGEPLPALRIRGNEAIALTDLEPEQG